MNRRVFLSGAATLMGAATLPAAMPQVVDTHIHLYDPTRPQGVPWPAKTDPLLYQPTLPPRFTALAGPLGVRGAVVIEASPWVEDNQWVLDLAKENPVIVALVGHLEPAGDDFAANLTRFARNPLFRGIRLNGNVIVNGVTRQAFLNDLERLADAGLMMDAIGGASMIPALQLLTGKIPKLRIAIDHMPGEPTGWQNSRQALLELAKQPQVYCKVSGVLKRVDGKVSGDPKTYQPALDEIWEAFGPDRVIYGSNWPVSDHLASYETVLSVMQGYVSTRTRTDADKFFAINSKACYRWVERG